MAPTQPSTLKVHIFDDDIGTGGQDIAIYITLHINKGWASSIWIHDWLSYHGSKDYEDTHTHTHTHTHTYIHIHTHTHKMPPSVLKETVVAI